MKIKIIKKIIFLVVFLSPLLIQSQIITDQKSEENQLSVDSANVVSLTLSNNKVVKNPTLALWLSVFVPGAGQIYNEEYWYYRVPVIWGIGAWFVYSYSQNKKYYNMHKDLYNEYSYYLRNKKNNSNLSYAFKNEYEYLNTSNIEEAQILSFFKKRRDYFIEKKETAMVFLGLTYFLQVVDAYIVARFTTFDINEDLNLKINPITFNYNENFEETFALNFCLSF